MECLAVEAFAQPTLSALDLGRVRSVVALRHSAFDPEHHQSRERTGLVENRWLLVEPAY